MRRFKRSNAAADDDARRPPARGERPRRLSGAAAKLALGVIVCACTGEIQGADPRSTGPAPPGAAGRGESTAPAGDSNTPCGLEADVGFSPLSRLTRVEYDNIARDVLGDDSSPSAAFVSDDKLGLFDANIASSVQDTMVSAYMTSAETMAAKAVRERLGQLAPCQETGCARLLIESLGRRLYRRPLAELEVARLTELFDLGSRTSSFAHGAELVLQAMLQSPYFLYHVENGTGTSAVQRLTSFELAARLSFFLWESAPDDTLLDAAAREALATPEAVTTQARRMLSDPRASAMTRRFYHQWLRVSQLEHLLAEPQLVDSMVNELDAFIDQVTWKEGGTLGALFNSQFASLDESSRRFYGVSDATAPAAPAQPYQLDPAQRSGLLTRAPFLASSSTVPARGKFVTNQLLCQPVPDPDPALTIEPIVPDANAPERSQWATHEVSPACKGCHAALDPVGFGFLHYDRQGKYRAMDRQFAIDATGSLSARQPDIDGPYDGAIDLSRRLAKSAAVRACISDIWFTVALDRPSYEQDECSKRQLRDAFSKSDGNIPELLVAMTTLPAFSYRRRAP